ncbi:olfactory receptor 1J4-like [Sorex araneus]|uniref:olfactory receptor 1J4-like n=1 Tax=Sorex araneus TaxID=42254 RepID=UPI00243400B1|nr:olfactory receptor 1J4-like [Sorex araneus]
MDNQSCASEFLLLGLPSWTEKQDLYYALFLSMYLTTVLGNLLIILLIRLDSRLHTPMYFFLSHLALTDVSFSSVIAPKMLFNMQTQSQSISYAGCVSQMYFFVFFGDIDSLLLTSMAYDRYVAICHPLHYTTIMSQNLCILLVTVSWVLSCASALSHTLLLIRLSFCGDYVVPHFFCDLSALLKLSTSDTTVNDLAIFTVGTVVITVPFICILVSYGRIGATILKTPSAKGIFKAFSTCGSHLTVVSLYYGSIIGLYFFPSSNHSNNKDVIVAILYTFVTPMLNPFIYSLRNRDMKGALRNIFTKKISLNSCLTMGLKFYQSRLLLNQNTLRTGTGIAKIFSNGPTWFMVSAYEIVFILNGHIIS